VASTRFEVEDRRNAGFITLAIVLR
jgi:hypothetical protein